MTPGAPSEDGRPSMTEVVDARKGSVRVSGHLTVQGLTCSAARSTVCAVAGMLAWFSTSRRYAPSILLVCTSCGTWNGRWRLAAASCCFSSLRKLRGRGADRALALSPEQLRASSRGHYS